MSEVKIISVYIQVLKTQDIRKEEKKKIEIVFFNWLKKKVNFLHFFLMVSSV